MAEDIARLGIQVLSDDVVKATRRLDKLENQSKQSEKQNKKLGTSFGMLGGAVTALAGGLAVGKFFKTAASFETMAVSLETVTGSAEKANMAMLGIQEFAKNTPFSVAEITQSFIKLKALGIEPTEASLESFGNTSSAMGKSLDQMIEAVADAATGEFERLKEFGIKASKQGDQVKFTFQGVTTTVKNSSEDITGYLESIGKTNFAGAMIKQMDTLNGKTSVLGDSVDALIVKLAADSSGSKGMLDLAIDAVNWLTDGITEVRIGFVKTLAATDIFFVEATKKAESFANDVRHIWSSPEETKARQKAIEEAAAAEVQGILNAAEAYISSERKKEEAKGSISKAGKGKKDPEKEESDKMDKLFEEEILVFDMQNRRLEMEEFESNEKQRILDERFAAEEDYYSRLFNLQAGSMKAGTDFANMIREGDYKGAVKNGALMLSNAAKQSKSMFDVQKAFSLANAAVALPDAVMQSFRNGGGYPFGLIPAGLMLKAGIDQINSIKSTSFGSKGVSAPSISGGSTSPSAPVASGLPEGSTAIPSGGEQRAAQVQELHVTVEGDGAGSDYMRTLANNLADTIEDMGGVGRLVVT